MATFSQLNLESICECEDILKLIKRYNNMKLTEQSVSQFFYDIALMHAKDMGYNDSVSLADWINVYYSQDTVMTLTAKFAGIHISRDAERYVSNRGGTFAIIEKPTVKVISFRHIYEAMMSCARDNSKISENNWVK